MSIIGCILIAAIAHRWKSALIAAFVVGLLGSTAFGFLRWEDSHYGTSPTAEFLIFYVATGTAAFTAETIAFFAVKLGFNAWRVRRKRTKTSDLGEHTPVSLPPKLEVPRVNGTVAVLLGVAGLLILALVISIQPFRDHLRQRYGFEPPEYYDRLPADTDANRIAVIKLLADQDREKAALREAFKPSESEPGHGRTISFGSPIVTNPSYGPPRSLADWDEIERSACHLDLGLLDRTLDLCRSVDRSARAAEHYAHDVENYWIPRLRPNPLIAPILSPSK